MTRMEPWNIRDPNVDDPAALARLSAVVYTLAETLRVTSILLQPYIPIRASDALDRLGVRASRRTSAFAVRGADAEYGMSTAALPEGKGAEGSLFPPLPSSEFEGEEGEPLEEDKKARAARKRKGGKGNGGKERRGAQE